ncbi:hypothetical protein NUACC21_37520 [Scytonema sp. NUACC21]
MKPDTLSKVLATFDEGGSEGSIYFAFFDCTVPVFVSKKIDDYDKRCIEAFFDWGETIFIKLQSASFEYYKDYSDACDGLDDLIIGSPPEIWQYCKPINIHFESSDEDPNSTFVDVELDCDWEPEHGMQWLVKNTNFLMYVGPYYGNASPNQKVDRSLGNYAEFF